MIHTRALLAAAVAALAIAAGGAQAANLIVNGSFETGDFTGWTLTGDNEFTSVYGAFGGINPEDGAYQSLWGSVSAESAMSQTFTDVSGDRYLASVWMASQGGAPSNFGVTLDGVTRINVGPVNAQGYKDYTFNFIGTGLDTLLIYDQNKPDYNLVDNVSVTSTTAVPEPAAWGLMLIGFGSIGAALRTVRGAKTVAA